MDKNTEKDNLSYCFVRGSDPRAATCRGKLQNRRCKLNQEINKELRLRAGAENLFKATTNRKLRDTVALELSFVNSNLQLLKEQLAELNSSVEIYQNNSNRDGLMPMIPLGLKETKEINFIEPFSEFIHDHYGEDPNMYLDAIADITDTRQAARTPSRDLQGAELLFRYYNLLYYVERRFFPPDKNLGIYFEWYDSLTGVPSCQRTIAFEKACILFNLGAIYTQIGAKHDRDSENGLDDAIDSFLRAAGIFRHIYDTFTNAPSMDLKPQVLDVLVNLLLSQARECLFEKLRIQNESTTETDSSQLIIDLAGEASQLSQEYQEMHTKIQENETQTYLPECWAGLIPLKAEYYKAISHYYMAKSIDCAKSKTSMKPNKCKSIDSFNSHKYIQEDFRNSKAVKRAHLLESLNYHEESQRLQRMCRFLKNKTYLTQVLREAHLRTREEYESFREDRKDSGIDNDFDLVDVTVEAFSKFTLSLAGPDFTAHKVEDPFKLLGPIAIFSSRRHWTPARCVQLQKGTSVISMDSKKSIICTCDTLTYSRSMNCNTKNSNNNCCNCTTESEIMTIQDDSPQSFGFHIRGDAPVIVSYVEANSLADLGSIKEGDFIVEISGIDVKWSTHQHVVRLIQEAGSSLELKLITPIDKNYLKPALSTKGSISTLSAASSSGVSSGSSSPIGTTTKPKSRSKSTKGRLSTFSANGWNPFKRTHSLGKIF